MAEIKIPVVNTTADDISIIGIHFPVADAISLIPLNKRSHVTQTVAKGILYIQGPAEELNLLAPGIKKVLTDHATWLLAQAEKLNIHEKETKL